MQVHMIEQDAPEWAARRDGIPSPAIDYRVENSPVNCSADIRQFHKPSGPVAGNPGAGLSSSTRWRSMKFLD
jgi:hypothetical protein